MSDTAMRVAYKPSKSIGRYFSPEEDVSVADKVALLDKEEQDAILADLDMDRLQYDNNFWCRPSQLELIDSTYWLTVALAGRGWGKSFTLSKAIHKYAMAHPGCRLALLGRTTSDVRDVMIMGDSGIMNVIDESERPEFKPNIRRLIWENGSEAITFSAERPDGIRGVQFHASFCDEVAAYRSNPGAGLINAFDQIKLATRLGEHPQIFVATTPKRVPMIVDILKQAEEEPDRVMLVRGSTLANRHLSNDYKDIVTGMYAGTTLGKQEIDGELLTDVEGALLIQQTIDAHRNAEYADTDFWRTLPHRVIGVDPSVSANPNDECGIVAVGATGEKKLYKRDAYVLEDGSMLGSPEKWARKAVEMARRYNCPIIAESNQGGELVKLIIEGIDAKVPVLLVHAKVSKFQRAEPVAAAYERGRVHHVGHPDDFEMLESQWTGWAPHQGLASPDRMDACVHALTALLITPPKGMFGKISVASDFANRILPNIHDYDPHGPVIPSLNRGGRAMDAARERLRYVQGLNPDDLNAHDAEEENNNAQFRAADRSGRLSIALSTGRSATAYGPPNRFRR